MAVISLAHVPEGHRYCCIAAGVIIDEHEYKGPLVGEINANGSPVTFAQQQQGMLQHSEVFGRYSAEDAPATLPFDASGNMQPAVQQNPCLSQV